MANRASMMPNSPSELRAADNDEWNQFGPLPSDLLASPAGLSPPRTDRPPFTETATPAVWVPSCLMDSPGTVGFQQGQDAAGHEFNETLLALFETWPPAQTGGSHLEQTSSSVIADAEDFSHVPSLKTHAYETLSLWVDLFYAMQPGHGVRLPPVEILNAFIQLYFEAFHDTLPILHQPTFNPNTANCLLVLAVAEIGCRFSRIPDAVARGAKLRELVDVAIVRHVCS